LEWREESAVKTRKLREPRPLYLERQSCRGGHKSLNGSEVEVTHTEVEFLLGGWVYIRAGEIPEGACNFISDNGKTNNKNKEEGERESQDPFKRETSGDSSQHRQKESRIRTGIK